MPNYNGIYTGSGFSDRMRDRARDMLRRTFKNAITYKEIDKYNVDGTITNDFPIQISKSSNKMRKYKNFISHPDYPVGYGNVFKLSDYFLIVTELNDSNQISDDGVMWKCNDVLKWKFDGTIYEQKCFIDKKGTTLSDSSENFTVLNNKIITYAQSTDDIKNIDINQDFIFGNYFKTVYKLIDIDDSSKDGLLIMTMKRTQSSTSDNLTDNVADNPNADSDTLKLFSSIDDTYYLVTPKDAEITVNTTVSVNIEHYGSDNIIIATNFDYQVTGVVSTSYDLNIIDDNNVEITCNEKVGNAVLEITNVDNSETLTYDFSLTGLW
jgi:hypothetical protein